MSFRGYFKIKNQPQSNTEKHGFDNRFVKNFEYYLEIFLFILLIPCNSVYFRGE